MRFGSLFSGVGGMDIGLENAGWELCWQVENDEACQQVLQHNWPFVQKWFDITDLHGSRLEPVEVVAFGSPCQDLSIAGKRKGLDGRNSQLFYEATRIIKEMRDATGGEYPKWAIWENVTGALTSNGGHDFERVIGEMENIGASIVEWTVLDAQFFGVPHRRKRIFLVACFDNHAARRCRTQIFPITKGNRRYPPPVGKRKTDDPRFSQNHYGEGAVAANHRTALPCLTANIYHKGTFNVQDFGSGFFVIYDNPPAVRKLTPNECERLMGWPDDHTKFRSDNKINLDSARYKMCGNGVVAPVATWVAKQLERATDGLRTVG